MTIKIFWKNNNLRRCKNTYFPQHINPIEYSPRTTKIKKQHIFLRNLKSRKTV